MHGDSLKGRITIVYRNLNVKYSWNRWWFTWIRLKNVYLKLLMRYFSRKWIKFWILRSI